MTDSSNAHPTSPVVALTIAGSDSGGGAGIAADLKTFAAHRVFGTVAITAVTAQNTEKVHSVHVLDPVVVNDQIESVLADFDVVAAKTGMLATVAIIEMLRDRARDNKLPPLVVDPVMVSSSGASLVEGDASGAYRRLLAHAHVTTPNLREAEALLHRPITSVSEMREAARAISDFGTTFVVVKGGHLDGDDAVDVVYDGTEIVELHATMIATRNVHGTGCTLSAAIAANLAHGLAPIEAIEAAKRYVTDAIAASASWELGSGPGPLDHFPRHLRGTGST